MWCHQLLHSHLQFLLYLHSRCDSPLYYVLQTLMEGKIVSLLNHYTVLAYRLHSSSCFLDDSNTEAKVLHSTQNDSTNLNANTNVYVSYKVRNCAFLSPQNKPQAKEKCALHSHKHHVGVQFSRSASVIHIPPLAFVSRKTTKTLSRFPCSLFQRNGQHTTLYTGDSIPLKWRTVYIPKFFPHLGYIWYK